MARDIRQRALEKIASLSASSSITSFDRSDLDRLCRATSLHNKGKEAVNGTTKSAAPSLGQVPMVTVSIATKIRKHISHTSCRLSVNMRFSSRFVKLLLWFKTARVPRSSSTN